MTPHSPILGRIKALLGLRTAAEKWNAQYAAGRWTNFDRLEELAHYSVLAGYALHLRPGGLLLDVGCGDAALRAHLHPSAFSRYIGLDFAEPIARARSRAYERTEFIVGDMRDFEPSTRFDTIVFNESLYYVPDAVGQLDRYARWLNTGGVFLISTHLKPNSEQLWSAMSDAYALVDHTTVTNAQGTTWRCGALRVKTAAPTS